MIGGKIPTLGFGSPAIGFVVLLGFTGGILTAGAEPDVVIKVSQDIDTIRVRP